MPGIAIRVDSKESTIGIGNVLRSIALARELGNLFLNVYFFTKYDASAEIIRREGFNVFKITNYSDTKIKGSISLVRLGEDVKEVGALFEKHNVETLVLDLPNLTEEHIKVYRPYVRSIIHIQDYPHFVSTANVLINGSLISTEFDYHSRGMQIQLTGTKYCLVDHQIAEIKKNIKTRPVIKNIFFYVADLDKHNLLPSFLQIFLSDPLSSKLNLHIVINSYFSNYDEIKTIGNNNSNVTVYDTSDDVLNIMSTCDIGITNDFYSIHRLVAFGIPTISFLTPSEEEHLHEEDNHNELIELVWEKRFVGLVNTETNIAKMLLVKVLKLIDNNKVRTALIDKGISTIDLRGAERTALAIKPYL